MVNIHRTIEVPEGARLFFCTDVHGRLDELEQLLRRVDFSDKDYLISVGDLHDRGPKSLDALNMFLNPTKPNLHALLGNHEHMLMRKDLHNLFYNGGQWALEQSDETIDYLSRKLTQNFFYAFTVEKDGYTIGCVHAEVPLQYDTWEDFLEDLARPSVQNEALWSREYIYDGADKVLPDVDYVLHGHTCLPEPLLSGNRLYFDTGTWGKQSGSMTLLEFKSGSFEEHRIELQ